MIRHIVMFKFKEEAEGKTKSENQKKAKQMIDSLINKIDRLLSIEVGINMKHAENSNYDLVLTADLNTFEDLEYYQLHPDHQEVVAFMKKVVSARTCVDYEI